MNYKLEDILVKRHFVISDSNEIVSERDKAYYNAYLFANFGITLDKPELINQSIIDTIELTYNLDVPASFYDNPQNLKYYSCEEIFLEQLVSYFVVAIEGSRNENTNFNRIKLFEKELPKYLTGKEMVERKFYVLDKDKVDKKLEEITENYSSYKRPFSIDETKEFLTLYENGYYKNSEIKCKDNVFLLLDKMPEIAKQLDYKDVTKLSVEIFGEKSKNLKDLFDNFTKKDTEKLYNAFKNAHECPLSKRQAKYYNKIANLFGEKIKKDNAESPYALAKKELDKGNVLEAGKIFAKNGSLFERNIKMLLSRADKNETKALLEMLPDKNPTALIQLLEVTKDNLGARTFSFTKNGLVKKHTETDYEFKFRKSDLTEDKKELLKESIISKIENHYDSLEKMGKIYISDEFKNVAVPINTSTTGKGIDVLPTGSRLSIEKDNVRSFVYWENAFDIDSSLLFIEKNGRTSGLDFRNYYQKPFGYSCLFSGDVTGPKGAEYYDLKLSKLKEKGVSKIIQTFHGYNDNLNVGEIKSGFQYKDDLETKAWDPKNIQMEMNIKGDTRGCVSFAIDLETKEVVILNQMVSSDSRVIKESIIENAEKYLDRSFLDVNMETILNKRGEIVDSPEKADVVFDRDYIPKENQEVVRPYEIEKLVSLVNDGIIKIEKTEEKIENQKNIENKQENNQEDDYDDVFYDVEE